MIYRSDIIPDSKFYISNYWMSYLFLGKIKKMIIRAITKSQGKVIDKYTVYFMDGSCLTLSSNPDSPQGVSQWGEYFGINDATFEEAIENNKQLLILGRVEELVNFCELPSIIKSHIEKRIADAEENL